MEDPLTGDVPASVAREEEEEAAQAIAHTYADAPQFLWTSQGEQALADGQLHCHLLVVAVSVVASALLQPLLSCCQLAAKMRRPASQGQAHRTDQAGSAELYSASGGHVIICVCSTPAPAERTVAWARLLLQHVVARHLVLLTSMPAVDFHGTGASTKDSQYVMETAAAHSTVPHGLPHLPSGNLIAGLPAAILSLCQIQEQPAIALVDVQEGASPDLKSLQAVASNAQTLLQQAGWPEADLMAKEPAQLAAACRTLVKASQRQSRAALFV